MMTYTFAMLYRAIKEGDLAEVKRGIEQNGLDPMHDHSEPLRKAAEAQKPDIVEYLIPLSDPKAHDSLALRWACEKKGIECVELLLPHSNPKDANSSALRLAVVYGNIEGARLLFPLSNPEDAFKELNNPSRRTPKYTLDLFQELWAEDKAARMKKKLEDKTNKTKNKKTIVSSRKL